MVDICGYELQTNLQNLTQKDLTEVKIFQKGLEDGLLFSETPCIGAATRRICLAVFAARCLHQAWPLPSCGVCLSVRVSVCLSVTFVHSVKTGKHIVRLFLTVG